MKQVSSKEFDVVLNILLNTGWESTTEINERLVAKQVGTKRRYVKEIIKKFTSNKKDKYILGETSEKHTYNVLIGKSPLLYQEGDRYCKKFAYFYSKAFQRLSIYAKRLLLSSGMSLSTTGQREVYLAMTEIMSEYGTRYIPTKVKLIETLEEIKEAFKGDIDCTYVGNCLTRQDMIHIQFLNGIEDEVIENDFEKRRLLRTLFEYGYYGKLTDKDVIELQKTLKYMYNGMTEPIKKGQDINIREDISRTLKTTYKTVLKRFAGQLHRLQEEGEKEGSLSAYLSSVIFSSISEEMVKVEEQKENIKSIYKTFNTADIEMENRIIHLDELLKVYETFITNWVDSRIEKKEEVQQVYAEQKVRENNKLKSYLVGVFTKLDKQIRVYGSKKRIQKEKPNIAQRLLENIEVIIDTYNERIGTI